MVERVVWDHEVAGSIPVTSTIKKTLEAVKLQGLFVYIRPYTPILDYLQLSLRTSFFIKYYSKLAKIIQNYDLCPQFCPQAQKILAQKLNSQKYIFIAYYRDFGAEFCPQRFFKIIYDYSLVKCSQNSRLKSCKPYMYIALHVSSFYPQ